MKDLESALWRSSQVVVVELDSTGRVIRANRLLSELSGLGVDEIPGRDWFATFLPLEEQEDARRAFVRTVAGDASQGHSNVLLGAHGQRRIISWQDYVMHDDDGGVRSVVAMGQDVTAEVAAQQALRQSRERFRQLVEGGRDVFFSADVEGRVTYVSPAIRQLLGYEPREIIGHSFLEFVAPERLADAEELFRAAISGREMGVFEMQVLTMAGELKWVEATALPIIRDGEMTGTQGLVRDVDKTHEAQANLSWEASANAALADLARGLLTSTSVEDQGRRVLSYGLKLTGGTLGYVGYVDPDHGRLVCTTMGDETRAACPAVDDGAVYHRDSGLWGWSFDHRAAILTNHPTTDSRAAGTLPGHFSIESFLCAPALSQGRVIGQVALANKPGGFGQRDLRLVERLADLFALAIERERSSQLLERSELRFRTLVEHIGEGVGVVDAEERFLFANTAAERIFGVAPGQLEGRSLADFVSDEGLARVLRETARRREGAESAYQLQVVRPDGQLRDLLVTATPRIDRETGFVGSFGIFRDITEIKAAERERETLIKQLRESVENIRTLHGMLPICARCKKIRDDAGYWHQVEVYVRDHADVEFTHGLCPDCLRELYGDLVEGTMGEDKEEEAG